MTPETRLIIKKLKCNNCALAVAQLPDAAVAGRVQTALDLVNNLEGADREFFLTEESQLAAAYLDDRAAASATYATAFDNLVEQLMNRRSTDPLDET